MTAPAKGPGRHHEHPLPEDSGRGSSPSTERHPPGPRQQHLCTAADATHAAPVDQNGTSAGGKPCRLRPSRSASPSRRSLSPSRRDTTESVPEVIGALQRLKPRSQRDSDAKPAHENRPTDEAVDQSHGRPFSRCFIGKEDRQRGQIAPRVENRFVLSDGRGFNYRAFADSPYSSRLDWDTLRPATGASARCFSLAKASPFA